MENKQYSFITYKINNAYMQNEIRHIIASMLVYDSVITTSLLLGWKGHWSKEVYVSNNILFESIQTMNKQSYQIYVFWYSKLSNALHINYDRSITYRLFCHYNHEHISQEEIPTSKNTKKSFRFFSSSWIRLLFQWSSLKYFSVSVGLVKQNGATKRLRWI